MCDESWLDDNIEEFKDDYWAQGRLLMTKQARRWDKETQERADSWEKRRAYVDFNEHDEGRSRRLVCIYRTPEECAAAVAKHNKELAKRIATRAPSEGATDQHGKEGA